MTERAEIMDRARRALQIADEVDAAAVERLQRGINDWRLPEPPRPPENRQRAWERAARAISAADVLAMIDARLRVHDEAVGSVIAMQRRDFRDQLEALRLELRKESAEVLQSEIIGRLDKMAALIDLVAAGQGVLARLDGTADAKKPH